MDRNGPQDRVGWLLCCENKKENGNGCSVGRNEEGIGKNVFKFLTAEVNEFKRIYEFE
jgi:hypothetical protein